MKGYIAGAVAIILIAASLPYVYQISRRQVLPTLSTWLILVVATSLNVTSYLVATRADILSGALGLADAFVCWCILIVTVLSTGFKLRLKMDSRELISHRLFRVTGLTSGTCSIEVNG
jgi:hypothetical protein